MNRLWSLWCALSGADPSDSSRKMAFNIDRRVAALSAHNPDLVEGFATYVWSADRGMSQDNFLDRWLAEVTADQLRRDDVAARELEERAAATARRHQAEQDALRRELDQAEQRRLKDEEVRRREERAAAEALRAERATQIAQVRRRMAVIRSQVVSLYNITALDNLASIASRGILCHDLAQGVRHVDLSNRGVQDRRDGKVVNGRRLHEYANLYFNPRNAMLAAVQHSAGDGVVLLEVSADVLELPGTVICDGNATNNVTRSWPAVSGLKHLDLSVVRSYYRRTPEGEVDYELRRATQAEVLVPDRVPARFIEGVIAPSETALELAAYRVGHWPGRIERERFFANWNH